MAGITSLRICIRSLPHRQLRNLEYLELSESLSVHCRTGSLEMIPKIPAYRQWRSLPHRQLRNYPVFLSIVRYAFTAAQAA